MDGPIREAYSETKSTYDKPKEANKMLSEIELIKLFKDQLNRIEEYSGMIDRRLLIIEEKLDKLLPDDKQKLDRAKPIVPELNTSDREDILGLTEEEAHRKRDLNAAGTEKLSKRGVHKPDLQVLNK